MGTLTSIKAAQPSKDRISWVDACKGTAIFVVVLYHVTLGLSDASLLNKSPFLEYFWVYATAVATPVFFLLSGYFIERSVEKSGRIGFLKTSLHYVLYPYILWSVLQLAAKIAFSSYVNTKASFDISFLLFDPVGQFWFLHSLFIAQLIYLAFHRLSINNYLIVSVLAMAVSFSLVSYETLSEGLRATSFVFLGAYAQRNHIDIRIINKPIIYICVFLYIISGLIYHLIMIPSGYQDASNFLGGISSTILLAALFTKFNAPKTLLILGRYSMYIYVLHIMSLVPFRVILKKVGLVDPLIMIPLCTLAGLVLPILFAIIVERLKINPLLGIKTASRP